jgi:diguanylate cyclase (GGDEF)-like protein
MANGDMRLAALIYGAEDQLRHEPIGWTSALAGVGLPSAITMAIGDVLIVVAAPRPDQLGTEAGSLLALILAHTRTALDRLHELDHLSHRADRDPLTGLRHQRPFVARLAASVPGRTVVFAVDVDRFKSINDRYGHQAGDVALVTLVEALRSVLREGDELYRIGGDEFAVLVDVGDEAEVPTIARRLLAAARRAGHPVSIGAALRGADETGQDTLGRADAALYSAKRAGRNTARIA